MRGRAAALAVVAEAADGYRAVFTVAESDSAFVNQTIVVADRMDGKPLDAEYGPYQIIVPAEKRHARWIRQLTCLRVVQL